MDKFEETNVDTRETNSGSETATTEKTFTQDQINELIGRARKEGRESAMRDLESQLQSARDDATAKLREKYGVNDDSELDALFGKGQQYDSVFEENTTYGKQLKDKDAFIALLQSNIPASRFDDVKAILGAKGLEITSENIQNELATHPEWLPAAPKQESGIIKLDTTTPESHDNSEEKEFEDAMRVFGYR